MAGHSNTYKLPFGAARLCQDLATLVNNRQGSDIQFKVGGGTSILREDGETIYNESETVTLYAHSLILRCRSRYFAAMLDEDKHWKESSNGVIYKPNISPGTFQDVLHYIYTGNVRATSSKDIIELITAADEMDLEELSTECQSELIRTFKYIFSDEDDDDIENESREEFEGSENPRISIDVAIRTHIIPALNLSSSHSLSHLSQKLHEIMLPRMSPIIKSPEVYTTFISEISFEAFSKIIASDNLAMPESSVWDLALSWGCHQTKLSKADVEARLNNFDNDEDDGDEPLGGTLISSSQLKLLKKTLAPLLPSIRFSLLDREDYSRMIHTLSYFLSRRRSSELSLFIFNSDYKNLPDAPRKGISEEKISSKITVDSNSWKFLRETIFGTGGITSCRSLNHLKFELLFRASEHGFLASTFHQRCDNKGPTLVLVKSADGHLFGGVNFNHWKSDESASSSLLNFLFALPDGCHRNNSAILTVKNDQGHRSSYNKASFGPIFGGGYDLCIENASNTNQKSRSNLPNTYNGSGASITTLAGANCFVVSDYEVFAISKK